MKRWMVLLAVALCGTCAAQDRQAQVEQMLTAPDAGPPMYAGVLGAVLSSKDADTKLTALPGTIGSTYAFVTALIFASFPGLHADTRITDPDPSLHVMMGGDPAGRVYLVKLAVNDRTNDRSVKLGHSGFASVSGVTAPDAKWAIPYTATQVKPGEWTLTPKAPLAPGEYGVFVGVGTMASGIAGPGGELYGFGVDPPK